MIAARMPSLTSPYGLHLPARQHLSSLRSRRAFVGYMHASFMDACIRWLSDGSRYACLSMNGYYGPITNTVLLLPSQQSQNDLSPAQHGRRDSNGRRTRTAACLRLRFDLKERNCARGSRTA
jgi:hypothetical protein